MKLRKIGSVKASQTAPISLRCYTGNYKPIPHFSHNDNANNGMVLSLGTETTLDSQQTLTFGSCAVWVNGMLYKIVLFHDDDLDSKKIELVKQAGGILQQQQQKGCTVLVMTKSEFVTNVFYPYVYTARAKCIGFDLPYELSRLASSWTTARKVQDAFSIKLVENNPRLPSIRIKSISSNAAFIQFVTPLRTKSEKKKVPTHKVYRGYFVDLKTLGYATSNDSFDTLHDLGKKFGVDTGKKCGKGITKKSIRDNIERTLAIHNLYSKIASVLQDAFQIRPNHSNRLYSTASIGKIYLEKLGIKPFLEKNPDFSKETLGCLMSAFFGGRVETRIRKKPVKVTCLDYASMYPSMFLLQDMNKFLTAQKVEVSHTKQETQRLLDGITLQDISNLKTWKQMVTLCKVIPNGNLIVPVRSTYDDSKKVQNIGVNYLKSTDETSLWYALPDIIASKLLMGHTPIIEDAISFVPVGMQEDLPDEDVAILKEVTVNPRKENLIQKLIEKRFEMQENHENEFGQIIQNTVKIISNTAAYGDYIQVNSEPARKDGGSGGFVTVYGNEKPFSVDARTLQKTETPARHFNPIIGTFLTAGARLVLAAAENIVLQNKDGHVAYCDTDSIFVSPKHAVQVQEFFQRLNPYDNRNVQMFKIEKSDDGKLLENVLFYGISSKRYVLYDCDHNGFTIHKCMLHGLGYLLDVDEKRWWHDILDMHHHPENQQEILGKYDDKYAVSKLSITTPNVLKRFSGLRPFNKMLVGSGHKKENGNTIIPTTSYLDARKRKCIQYVPFTNYVTGQKHPNSESVDTSPYWKPLSQVLDDYANHKETKSGGDIGLLPRLRMKIDRNLIRYVGKETTNLDASSVLGVTQNSNCTVYDNLEEKIANIRPRDSHKFGISRSNLISLQKRIRENGVMKLHKRTIEKIISGSIMARGGDAI